MIADVCTHRMDRSRSATSSRAGARRLWQRRVLLGSLLFLVHPATALAQGQPRISPLMLLTAPEDGLEYFKARSEARALLSARRFAEAEPVVEQLVRDYPFDGENWNLYARVKAGLSKHAEAANAFEQVGALIGWRMSTGYWAGYNAAAFHLAAGDRRKALDMMRAQVFQHRGKVRDLFDWAQFSTLREDPEFLEIIGRPDTAGWTRDYGWRRDIAHLHEELLRVHPDYHDAPLPPDVERGFADLSRRVPELTDEEIFVEMNRILARLRHGHIYLWWDRPEANELPLQFYAFPEGIFVVDAFGPHEALIGSQVLAIASTPVEAALSKINELQSDESPMSYLWTGPHLLRQILHLGGLGIVDSDTVHVTVRSSSGSEERVSVVAQPVTRRPKLPAPRNVPAPLFLRNVQAAHWETALPEHDALYVQMNQVRDGEAESLPDFGRRLRTVLGDVQPRHLILDLRHNNGGTTQKYPEFLRTVIGYTTVPGNRLFVLIGRNTYSAAANLITDLERLADPVFVGEASSQCCNFYGDPSLVSLPYSGINAELTSVKWNLSHDPFDDRRQISPHVPVVLTAHAYFSGEDPVLEAVYRMIREGVR
jgi:tetratricopeptide (TPR) repeat protein